MKYLPSVFVILLNWNRPKDTLECIASLREQPYPNSHVVVVDNGSSDDSVERIRCSGGGNLTLLEAGENLGFTGGNNLGVQYALDHGADYVWVLNNDTIVLPGALETLVQAAETDAQIGMVSPKILFHPEHQLVWFGGADYDKWFLIGRCLGYGQKDVGQFDREQDIPWATGCALLIRREVLETVGLLNNDYFSNGEDLDYSLNAITHGYRIRYTPSSVIWHKEAVAFGGRDAPRYAYYQTRNLLFLHSRWAGSWHRLLISQIYALLYFVKRAFQFIWNGKWRSLIGLGYGIRDGLLGRMGRREYAFLSGTRPLKKQ